MPSLSILLLGSLERLELSGVREALERWGLVTAFSAGEQAAVTLANGEVAPDLIVVAQSYPGQFSHQVVERCRRLAPLARIVGLMGGWCEGEMRSGAPWPATVRSYWHQWWSRADREFSRVQQGRLSTWGLPLTATEEERLLADLEESSPCGDGLVVIQSRSREMADWLSAALCAQGYATVWQRATVPVQVFGARAIIYDGSDLGPDEEVDLRHCVSRAGGSPVIVLMSFPRADDCRRVRNAGGASVLSKPVSLPTLFWQLAEARTCH